MTDKAGLQPPERVMNVEALHKVGVGGWGELGDVSSLAECLGEGRGKKAVPGFSETKEERRG